MFISHIPTPLQTEDDLPHWLVELFLHTLTPTNDILLHDLFYSLDIGYTYDSFDSAGFPC